MNLQEKKKKSWQEIYKFEFQYPNIQYNMNQFDWPFSVVVLALIEVKWYSCTDGGLQIKLLIGSYKTKGKSWQEILYM